jgi:predicted nucleic acid-binding protein
MMNKKNVFVDTCAWLALSDESDQYNKKASIHLRKLIEAGYELMTTNLIIHETFMLLSRRISRKAAVSSANPDDRMELPYSNGLQIIYPWLHGAVH